MPIQSTLPGDGFDYVIIGAGSAGCALAALLVGRITAAERTAAERAADAAKNAKAKMTRFRLECSIAAADTNQLSLTI